MAGPSGAGKATWLASEAAAGIGFHSAHILSSDQVRHDLCGDFRHQTKNDAVFAALHVAGKARLSMVYRVSWTPQTYGGEIVSRRPHWQTAPTRYMVIDAQRKRGAGMLVGDLLLSLVLLARTPQFKGARRIGTPTTRTARSGEARRSVGLDGKARCIAPK
jgi:hypothetical protein